VRRSLALPWLVLCVVLAGCGDSTPKLGHDDAAGLIRLTNAIAREGSCAQARDISAVSARAIQLVNQGRVPAALQEPLLAGVNSLAAHHPSCEPPALLPQVSKPGHEPHKPHHDHGKHKGDD
jgi:hypothetical protein